MKKTTTAKKSSRYKVGDEFIYHNGKNLMDRVKIMEIIPGGYILSNQVRMNDSLNRIDPDAKKFNGVILPVTPETELLFNAFWAHAQLLRRLSELQRELMLKSPFGGDEEYLKRLIKLNKRLRK